MEAVAAGTGASISIAMLARRWFRRAVQDVVNDSISDVIKRQTEFEDRQGRHLDRQDVRLSSIERKLNKLVS